MPGTRSPCTVPAPAAPANHAACATSVTIQAASTHVPLGKCVQHTMQRKLLGLTSQKESTLLSSGTAIAAGRAACPPTRDTAHRRSPRVVHRQTWHRLHAHALGAGRMALQVTRLTRPQIRSVCLLEHVASLQAPSCPGIRCGAYSLSVQLRTLESKVLHAESGACVHSGCMGERAFRYAVFKVAAASVKAESGGVDPAGSRLRKMACVATRPNTQRPLGCWYACSRGRDHIAAIPSAPRR